MQQVPKDISHRPKNEGETKLIADYSEFDVTAWEECCDELHKTKAREQLKLKHQHSCAKNKRPLELDGECYLSCHPFCLE
jgi:hypothetical protein